jgi:hypothetical protein
LAEATTELVSSLDCAQTLARIARAAVPALVDRCVIDLEEGREVRRAVEIGAASGGTAIVVPIVWQDRAIGSITFANRPSSRALTEEDWTLVVDLAARAARAIEHARVNLERDHIARTLQTSLLPPAQPEAPGLDLAARYVAARGGAEVGGDFYDCFPPRRPRVGSAGRRRAGQGRRGGDRREPHPPQPAHDRHAAPVPSAMLDQLNEVVLRRREGCRPVLHAGPGAAGRAW